MTVAYVFLLTHRVNDEEPSCLEWWHTFISSQHLLCLRSPHMSDHSCLFSIHVIILIKTCSVFPLLVSDTFSTFSVLWGPIAMRWFVFQFWYFPQFLGAEVNSNPVLLSSYSAVKCKHLTPSSGLGAATKYISQNLKWRNYSETWRNGEKGRWSA